MDSIFLTDNLPDTGTPVSGSNYVVLNNVAAGVGAAVTRPGNGKLRIQPDMPVSLLMLTFYRACPAGRNKVMDRSWRGFITLDQYARERPMVALWNRPSGIPLPPFSFCQPQP